MELIVVSGRSGSGKSTALHQLEDLGYYCVDNLPAALLPTLTSQLEREQYALFRGVAVCIDSRNSPRDLEDIHDVLDNLPGNTKSKVLFLDASDPILIKRFSETRRRHPLTQSGCSLPEAVLRERELLESLAARSDLFIDTSNLNLYGLRAAITDRLAGSDREGLSLLIESFGFKRGVPADADLVFDARLLPNPHWDSGLRALTGKDPEVVRFLESYPDSDGFTQTIIGYLERWLPVYEQSQRSYMTVAIGCTGGQHRSVFVAERVFSAIKASYASAEIRHRELAGFDH